MTISWHAFVIVCPLLFLAGFVDSIAGGGGLISLPAYLFAGLPPHNALATNKLSSAIGTTISTTRYCRNGYVNKKIILPTVAAALLGSTIGSNIVLRTSDTILKYIMIIVLPIVAFYVLRNKNLENRVAEEVEPGRELGRQMLMAAGCALVIGGYDGFYGPGTGTFLLLTLTGLAGLDVRTASGNTKVINLSSNIAALVTWILSGKIVVVLGLAGAVCNMAGNYAGSGMVMKNGTKIVRPIILVVLIILFVKIITGN